MKMKREQYLIACSVKNAIEAIDTMRCSYDEQVEFTESEIEIVVKLVKRVCGGMAVDNFKGFAKLL